MTDLRTTPIESASSTSEPVHDRAADQRSPRRTRLVGVTVLAVAGALALAACGGSPKGSAAPHTNSKLVSAGTKALSQLQAYQSAVTKCGTGSNKAITCIELADRNAGNEMHLYANQLGPISEGADKTKAGDAALEAAQSAANSLEILGDAQPTQANYNQVLGHFDLSKAISTLESDINTVNAAYGG